MTTIPSNEFLNTPTVEVFTSSAQTTAVSSSFTVSHGLGGKPDIVQLYYKCTTSDMGYSVGDELIADFLQNDTTSSRGISVVPDAANIRVQLTSQAPRIPHKTTGSVNTMTASSWDLYVKAIRVG